jgi:hypothetical protein
MPCCHSRSILLYTNLPYHELIALAMLSYASLFGRSAFTECPSPRVAFSRTNPILFVSPSAYIPCTCFLCALGFYAFFMLTSCH